MNKLFLILIILFCVVITWTHAEEMTFALYGIAPTDEYSSLDWPEQIDLNKWRCVIIDINNKWYGYINLTTNELALIINQDGYVSLNTSIQTSNIMLKVGDYILIPIPSNRRKESVFNE